MVDRIQWDTVSYLPFYYVFFQFLLLTIFNLQANILTTKDILSNLVLYRLWNNNRDSTSDERRTIWLFQSRAALSLLAYCYFYMQDFANAADCYEQLTLIFPDVEDYKLYYAQALYQVKRVASIHINLHILRIYIKNGNYLISSCLEYRSCMTVRSNAK